MEYWNKIKPNEMKINDDAVRTLLGWARMEGEPGRLARVAVGLLNREFRRRAGAMNNNLGENLQRVIDKRISKECEEKAKKQAFSTPQRLRKHVF